MDFQQNIVLVNQVLFFKKNEASCYPIFNHVRGTFSLPNGGLGKKVVIFGVDMRSSVHIRCPNSW